MDAILNEGPEIDMGYTGKRPMVKGDRYLCLLGPVRWRLKDVYDFQTGKKTDKQEWVYTLDFIAWTDDVKAKNPDLNLERDLVFSVDCRPKLGHKARLKAFMIAMSESGQIPEWVKTSDDAKKFLKSFEGKWFKATVAPNDEGTYMNVLTVTPAEEPKGFEKESRNGADFSGYADTNSSGGVPVSPSKLAQWRYDLAPLVGKKDKMEKAKLLANRVGYHVDGANPAIYVCKAEVPELRKFLIPDTLEQDDVNFG